MDKYIKYRRSKKGRITRAYLGMKRRLTDRQYILWYSGLTIMNRDEFVEFSNSDKTFNRLYNEWRDSGFIYALTPTVDRLNPNEGYHLWNIEWVTLSENTKRMHQLKKVR